MMANFGWLMYNNDCFKNNGGRGTVLEVNPFDWTS